ncbi:MAG: O-antigen ligase family protein [Patescibacteria group bacterium]|nr:O-antigen ligase family protein [Patescibacteria group bacterium]
MNYFTWENKRDKWVITGFLALTFALSSVLFCFSPLVAAAIFLAFLVLAILAIKPEIGLYLMILFLPVIDLNFNVGNLVIPFIDLLAIVVLAAYFLRIFFRFLFFSKDELKEIKLPLALPFLIFFLSVSISNILAGDIFTNIWYSLRWIMFFYLAYVVLPVNIIREKKTLRNCLICFLISGLLVAVVGLVSLSQQDWYNEFVRVRPIGISGIYPIGENHNLIAEVLLVAIFFSLALKYWFKEGSAGRAINLLVIFLSLVLLGTFSRAAWLVLFLEAAIYLFYKSRRYGKKIILTLAVALIILSPLVVYMVKLQSQYEIGVSSTENRILMTEIAWQAFKEKPFFGQGAGEFINLVADNVRFRAKYGAPLDSHGLGQKILAENGLFGVLSFAAFVFCIFSLFYKSLKRYKNNLKLLLPLAVGSFGIFLFEFSNTSYYKGKLWLPIALTLAAIYLIRENKAYAGEKN